MNKQIDQLIEKIKAANSIAILMHYNPDGDAVGSASAMYELINDNFGKTAQMFYDGAIPSNLNFVPNRDRFIFVGQDYQTNKFDLVIAVDTGSLNLLKETAQILRSAADTVKIDHHGTSEDYANLNILDLQPSAAEVIYKIAVSAGWKINNNAANALLTGIRCDTGDFAFNRTSGTFKIAGELMDLGADNKYIADAISIMPMDATMANARAILNAKFYFDNKLAVSLVDAQEYEKLDGKGSHALKLLRHIEGVEYVAVIKQTDDTHTNVSFRASTKPVDMIAVELGGGGHKFAAAVRFTDKALDEVQEIVLESFEKHLNEKR